MMKNNSALPQSIDEYIALQAPAFRGTLEQLRSVIKSVVPAATESISYQVPCFRYLYSLVGIGVNKKYCSLYLMSSTVAGTLSEELAGARISGATLHFLPGEPLPVALIKKIVRMRVKENEQRALAKKSR